MDAETGRLARPLPVDMLIRPRHPKLENGAITYYSGECDFVEIKPGDDLLEPFLRLADTTGEGVLKYVHRYGALMLCSHGLPVTHNPTMFPDVRPDPDEPLGCDADFFGGMRVRESIDSWRMFAGVAAALTNIAVRLHQGEHGRAEDWGTVTNQPQVFPLFWTGDLPLEPDDLMAKKLDEVHSAMAAIRNHYFDSSGQVIGGERPKGQIDPRMQAIAEEIAHSRKKHVPKPLTKAERKRLNDEHLQREWDNVASVLDQWAALGDLRPRVRVNGRNPVIRLGGFLFGALALQLMSALTRTAGFAICSECGAAYVPSRQPRRGQQNYCEGCGRPAALRHAQRKRRSRLKK